MINMSLMGVFIPTFFFVSITPGMCMTLAMTLGMSVGFRRTTWMMAGELAGVGLVAALSAVGVAAVMVQYPAFFVFFKWCGGAWLAWIGIQMWMSKGKMALNEENMNARQDISRGALASQGFVTAIVNPKGWAFFIALLPPFIDPTLTFAPQLAALITIILTLECFCLCLYAAGGKSLRHFLEKSGNIRMMNRIAGSLMIGVGAWLAFDGN